MQAVPLIDATRSRAAELAPVQALDETQGRELAAKLIFGKTFEQVEREDAAGALTMPLGIPAVHGQALERKYGKAVVEAFIHAGSIETHALWREHLGRAPQVRRKFRACSFLVVYPLVDEHADRHGDVPWVDFPSIDFSALTTLYKKHLRIDESDSIYSLDDYIDVANAEVARRLGADRLEPYFSSVLKPTLRVRDDVAIVRDRWTNIHRCAPGRQRVAPPRMLGFVTEHYNFEDWLEWEKSTNLCLKTRTWADFGFPSDEDAGREPGQPGALNQELRDGLQSIFGVEFHPDVFFQRMATSPLPKWLQQSMASWAGS